MRFWINGKKYSKNKTSLVRHIEGICGSFSFAKNEIQLFQSSELPHLVAGKKKVARKGKFFEKLQKLVTERKLTLKKCSSAHYQIVGGKYLVNVYPFTDRGPIAHISGTSKGVSLTIEEMIQAAFELPTISSTERENTQRSKKILQKSSSKCYWCGNLLIWVEGEDNQEKKVQNYQKKLPGKIKRNNKWVNNYVNIANN